MHTHWSPLSRHFLPMIPAPHVCDGSESPRDKRHSHPHTRTHTHSPLPVHIGQRHKQGGLGIRKGPRAGAGWPRALPTGRNARAGLTASWDHLWNIPEGPHSGQEGARTTACHGERVCVGCPSPQRCWPEAVHSPSGSAAGEGWPQAKGQNVPSLGSF